MVSAMAATGEPLPLRSSLLPANATAGFTWAAISSGNVTALRLDDALAPTQTAFPPEDQVER
jgi:hypothetical protein